MSLYPPREASRATSEGIIISKYPDVCRSPTAPVPYTIVAYQNDDANTASSVFMTDQRAHKQNSIVTKCMGDEPGRGLGVKSNTVSSICHRKTHSKNVRVEGQWVTRHHDEWYMNNRNTVGKLVWPKHNLSFSPTPPIAQAAGSGGATSTASPVQLAFANTGIMSDASPVGAMQGNTGNVGSSRGGTRLAFLDTSKTGTGTTTVPQQTETGSRPQRSPPPSPKVRWWRFVKWGRRLNPYMNALELFFHQNPGYFADMPTFTEEEREIVRDAQRAIDDGADPQEVRRWAQREITAERQRVEEEEHSPPVPHARTDGNASIRGRRRRRRRNCRLRKYREGCVDALPYSTPHHVVPDRAFRTPAGELYNGGIPHADGYSVCVEGGTPVFRGPNANEHGLIHGIYNPAERALGLAGTPPGTARLDALEAEGVAAASAITGCDPAEMLRQLQDYHRNERKLSGADRFRADPTGKLSVDTNSVGRGTGRAGSRGGM